MTDTPIDTTLDIATLPLADGRHVAVPLLVLAEVQQLRLDDGGDDLGTLHWRGLELPVRSLDSFCGLPPAERSRHDTVGIFRSAEGSAEPFRALAFCGLAAHLALRADQLEASGCPEEGNFTAAGSHGGKTYLVPDLSALGYAGITQH